MWACRSTRKQKEASNDLCKCKGCEYKEEFKTSKVVWNKRKLITNVVKFGFGSMISMLVIRIISKFDIEEGISTTFEMEVGKATYCMPSISKSQIINGL